MVGKKSKGKLGVAKVSAAQQDLERVDTSTVNTLCNYFGCDVGDLFVMKEVKVEGSSAVTAGGAS